MSHDYDDKYADHPKKLISRGLHSSDGEHLFPLAGFMIRCILCVINVNILHGDGRQFSL